MTPDQVKMWSAMGLGPIFLQKDTPQAQFESTHAVTQDHVQVSADMQSPAQAVVDLPVSHGVAAFDWPALQQAVAACQQCELCKTRKQTVFGVGVKTAPVMVIGEAPGADEDAQGEPFVGQAGRLLDQMLKAITHSRHTNVFIANTLKCRPPGNRNPEPAEMQQCAPFLERQVELVNPTVLLLVGKFAIKRILGVDAPVSSLRGRVHQVTVGEWSGPAVVSYHPAYLLRSLTEKAKAWEDLCLLKAQLA